MCIPFSQSLDPPLEVAARERTYALQDANWNVTALVEYSTLTGDTNGDGNVNFSDFSLVIQFDGQSAPGGAAAGDFNDDGVTNNADLVMLLNNYTSSSTVNSWVMLERIAYSPYGLMTTYTPTLTANSGDFLAFNVTFQGMLYDTTTKLNFTLSRIYEASTGRFLTVDPVHADGMDWYRGFADNPIKYTDASGLQSAGLGGYPDNGMALIMGQPYHNYIEPPKQQDPKDIYVTPYQGSYIADRGKFNVTLDDALHHAPGLGTNYSVAQISFKPDEKVTKDCLCDKIQIVQVATNFADVSRFFAWHHSFQNEIDNHGPEIFYNLSTTNNWIRGGSSPAFIFDDPAVRPLYFFGMESFADYAICTKGKEAGHSYGYVTWGYQVDFHSDEAIRWINGLQKRGKVADDQVVNPHKKGENTGENWFDPLPGDLSKQSYKLAT